MSREEFPKNWECELMIKNQLEARGISPHICQAFRRVKREWFVPPHLKGQAYADKPLPIESSQTISQPYMVAWTLEQARLTPSSRVLDIGTGSGFQAAVASVLCKEVFTVEVIPELYEGAKRRFFAHGFTSIRSKCGDGHEGWEEYAPYDAIVVAACGAFVPRRLVEQLATGGRLIMPIGRTRQKMLVVESFGDSVSWKRSMAVRYVPFV